MNLLFSWAGNSPLKATILPPKFNVIGRLELLPQDVRDKIQELIEYTKDLEMIYGLNIIMKSFSKI